MRLHGAAWSLRCLDEHRLSRQTPQHREALIELRFPSHTEGDRQWDRGLSDDHNHVCKVIRGVVNTMMTKAPRSTRQGATMRVVR